MPSFVINCVPQSENEIFVISPQVEIVPMFVFASGSQSRMVWLSDADASTLPSAENATDITESEWPSRVPRVSPVAGSQSRTVWSSDADASTLPSAENATDITESEWPSRHCSFASQLSDTIGFVLIQAGIWPSNKRLMWLLCGLNTSAELYIWRGASSIMDLLLRTNRLRSCVKAAREFALELSFFCINQNIYDASVFCDCAHVLLTVTMESSTSTARMPSESLPNRLSASSQ